MILLLLFLTILAIVTTPSIIWVFLVAPFIYFIIINWQEGYAQRKLRKEEEKRQAKKKKQAKK